MRSILRPLLLIVVFPFISVPGNCNENPWELEKQAHGIKVFAREVEGWTVREVKAETTVAASLLSVLAVLNDVPSSGRINESIRIASVLGDPSADSYEVYMLMGMPWPVSDRDVVLKRTIATNPGDGSVRVSEVALQGVLPRKEGVVRVEKMFQSWLVTPIGKCAVYVETQTLVDPGGVIPSGIINRLSIESPMVTLRNLKKAVSEPQYRSNPSQC
ncbi:START domain-containing protein [Litorivivens sp.]|uniref:START domain-containing protein n=1 Tax=Litorivivens sp. TaxID=2020868 RepID=UPI003563409F